MMKKALMAVMVLAGLGLNAQRGPGPGHGNHPGKEMSAEQAATLHSKRMTLALGLDDRQQKEVKALLETEFQWRKETHEARKANRDSTAKADPETRYAHMNARLDHRISFERDLKEILSEAQFDQWKKHQHRKKGRKGHRRQKGQQGK